MDARPPARRPSRPWPSWPFRTIVRDYLTAFFARGDDPQALNTSASVPTRRLGSVVVDADQLALAHHVSALAVLGQVEAQVFFFGADA